MNSQGRINCAHLNQNRFPHYSCLGGGEQASDLATMDNERTQHEDTTVPTQHCSRNQQRRTEKRPRGPSYKDSRSAKSRRSKRPVPPPPPPCCSICQQEDPKYKCPKCRASYCSIACCKSHKEQGCQQESKQLNEKSQVKKKSKYLPSDTLLRDPLENALERRKQVMAQNEEDDNVPEGWKITEAMMDKMDNCDWLRKELQDGGLRQILHQVCSAPNTVVARPGGQEETHQQVALRQAKANYPNFSRFMDKLLVLTGVLERQETGLGLSDWLELQDAEELGPLALVPLPTKKRRVASQQDATEQDGTDDDASSSSNTSDDSDSSDSDSSDDSPSDDDSGTDEE